MGIAGIREARQNISKLIERVRNGEEIILTDRGKPVARLTRPATKAGRPFGSHRKLRESIKMRGGPLINDISADREDRA